MNNRYESSTPDCPLALLAPDAPGHWHDYEAEDGNHALIIGDSGATALAIEGPLPELRTFARRVADLVGLPPAGVTAAQPGEPRAWVLQCWDKNDDHVKLFAEEDSAFAYLAKGVRGDWDSITGFDGVPPTALADHREAVAIYYGDGDSPFFDDDGYELAPPPSTAPRRPPRAARSCTLQALRASCPHHDGPGG